MLAGDIIAMSVSEKMNAKCKRSVETRRFPLSSHSARMARNQRVFALQVVTS